DGDVSENTVIITNGTIADDVYGGYCEENGKVSGNVVTINGGFIDNDDHDNDIYGGYGDDGDVSGNTVIITNGTIGDDVFGGYSYAGGKVSGNTVKISGGVIGNDNDYDDDDQYCNNVYAGYSKSGEVSENTLSITGCTIFEEVYGGYGKENGKVSGNVVTINSCEIGFDVYGGYSEGSGKVSENIVTINGGIINWSVYGGYSYENGEVSGNIVIVNGGTVGDDVIGGSSNNGKVSKNTVIINDGVIESEVYGGSSDGEASENTIIINGGTIDYLIVGGFGFRDEIVSRNTVTITNGTISAGIEGGWGYGSGEVSENTVTICGGLIADYVYGGFSRENGKISGNTVIISGGTISDEVYGGYTYGFTDGCGEVSGNTVAISGGNLSAAEVYGYNDTASSHSNNTLQIENSVAIKKIANFDKVNFVLPTITGNKTLLTLTDVFSMAGLPVSTYVGDNLNSVLNTYDVTLANNVSGEFDIAYYDKDKNETGYVEKFNLASAGALVIGKGTEMHLTKNLTTGAGELLGKQNTLYVDNGVTLTLDGGTLKKNIDGNGTVKLGGTTTVLGNKSIAGILDGNGKILNMTDNTSDSAINTLNVGTLKGNIDLRLDVNLIALTNDMLLANAVDSGAKINVKSINITADNPTGLPSDANLTFMKENGTTPTHGTYTVNSPIGSITMTNNHTYKFEIGGNGIMKCSDIGVVLITFKDFIEGTNYATADTFSLTADYNYTDTGTANMAAVTQSHDSLNINLNGHNLNKTSSVMTVNTGTKTLNVNGGNTQGNTDLNFDVAAGGKLNVGGKTDLKGNIVNAGEVKFTDETKVEGTLSGAGS
ncbi:MAG: hypothetical protein KBS60_03690, partial [Phascolarctobacterium sp.]|nr:hypothetical protein [Candidatus Phascolarctobacterium caballi]